MLDTARRALRLVEGKTRADFDRDELLALALTHLVQVIGEAACKVGPAFRDSHPEIPWAAIVATRHRVVHEYLDVDEDVVWDVVTGDLLGLAKKLERIVE